MTARETIIVHDYFDIRGGGERLSLTLARELDSVLMYGFRTGQSYESSMFPQAAIDLGLPRLLRGPGMRAATLALRFAAARRQLRPYATRIFSGTSAPFAAEARPGVRNIYYCHTPPRFLYDQREHYADVIGTNLVRRLAVDQFCRGYERAVGRMDLIVANSVTVQERVRTYLGREAVVVYPPCDLETFQWHGQADFYLSTARHSPLKRVAMIIKAFLGMPEKTLVVASGGVDSTALRALAGDAPNIRFVGWTSDAQLRRLIGEAIATIYVPVEEDFGMSPVESMAAGKPVMGVAEGGLRETIIDGETGTLLPADFTVDCLARAVEAMTPARAAGMRAACSARSALFSQRRFVEEMRRLVDA